MMITKHWSSNTSWDIEVTEARLVELIDSVLFEENTPYLSFRDIVVNSNEVSGYFTIHARNGTWVYELTRECPWMPHVLEARLVRGEHLINTAVTSGSRTLQPSD